jgi:putative ATPase
MADGDGRTILNMAEEVFAAVGPVKPHLTREQLTKLIQRRAPLYDKSRDGHYNLISALHKSIRGSDPDASLYWFCRMLDGGEDRLFLARRLVRMAVEDIGIADPQALVVANAAKDAFDFLGSPEGELALANAVIYLATAPKSNAAYVAFKAAMKSAKASGSVAPPKIILNAPTAMMEEQGYGDGYVYDHNTPEGFSGQNYFPDDFKDRPHFYDPPERGFEREIRKRLAYWQGIRQRNGGPEE